MHNFMNNMYEGFDIDRVGDYIRMSKSGKHYYIYKDNFCRLTSMLISELIEGNTIYDELVNMRATQFSDYVIASNSMLKCRGMMKEILDSHLRSTPSKV